jgi:hypothetical protein
LLGAGVAVVAVVAVFAVVGLGWVGWVGAPRPAAASPLPGIPVPLPGGPVPLPGVPNPLPALGNAVGGLARDSANTALDAVGGWVSAGAASLLGALATEIDRSTNPGDAQPWLDGHFNLMRGIAALLAFPLLFAAAMTAIVRRDGGVLVRAAFVHLPLALIGTGAAMAIVGLALAGTDALCAAVTADTHLDAASLLRGLTEGLTHGGPGVTGFGLVLVSLLIAFGGFFLTIELVVRAAAIWVAMLFLPLGLIGLVWPGTARWGRRLGELLAVLILSKFVIVAIVSMAVGATASGVNAPNGPSLLGGAALLLLAAAAPFTLLRMVPLVEAGVVAHLDGVSRRAAAIGPAVQQAVNPPGLSRLLERASGGPDPGPPLGPAGSIPGSSTPEAIPTRGRDPDGTQSGADKPVPVSMPGQGGRSQASGAAGGQGGPPVSSRPEPGGMRRG